MKNHLYEDDAGVIHKCESSQATPRDLLVWTKCLIDVPADTSFKTYYEVADCPACAGTNQ